MGVTGLWEVVQPCARPIKIDTLNKKRLAIDASIWVYHFLKAVRDKEGNALRNSHVVGFYRRICKLLFFGIKPVFVFDGGAPVLKRQTITGRKARREGRREDATRTAGKLLALQMQKHAEDEEQRRQREAQRTPEPDDEEAVPENPVYREELHMTQQERQQNRRFRKKDQYHLPDLSVPLAEMGGPNDPRVMSMEELQQYAKQFETGEDINVYDFSKIDFDSPFFISLPATDRYNILNAARMRSRLRMGYSRDQLESMFPDRMEFSRFQIERVRERNELTQRLMHVGTAEEGMFLDAGGRVAGERSREYVLVKNSDVEGGWALGVIGDKDQEEGQKTKPIDVEEKARQAQRQNAELEEESSEAEDQEEMSEGILRRREDFYKARRREAQPKEPVQPAINHDDPDSLFVPEAAPVAVAQTQASGESDDSEDEEAQLQIALAMSLGKADETPDMQAKQPVKLPEQHKAVEHSSFTQAKGSVASIANARSQRSAPKSTIQGTLMSDGNSSDEDTMDLAGALRESRQSKHRPQSPVRTSDVGMRPQAGQEATAPARKQPSQNQHGFDGPLPFEKLDLGTSLLGRKKMKKLEEESAGGFVKDLDKNDEDEKSAQPPPPWFSADVEKGMRSQRKQAAEDRRQAEQAAEDDELFAAPAPSLRMRKANEVIDVDAMDEDEEQKNRRVIAIDSSDDEADPQTEEREVRMGDVADFVRAQPPEEPGENNVAFGSSKPVSTPETSPPENDSVSNLGNQELTHGGETVNGEMPAHQLKQAKSGHQDGARSDEELEWEESDYEHGRPAKRQKTSIAPTSPKAAQNAVNDHGEIRSPSSDDVYVPDDEALNDMEPEHVTANDNNQSTRSESPDDDLYVPGDDELAAMAAKDSSPLRSNSSDDDEGTVPMSGAADRNPDVDGDVKDEDAFSDLEEDQLMEQLAAEAEEHARFTSTFNHKTTRQNIEDYERELKALRTQQKKDRRDADEVTHIMIQECQQLLQLFGLPYITAPMEAEAQCAELVRLGLVDGIVTDDSDIFLFGGTRVYKNMFNQAKFVECYLASDLERDFDLTRDKLINMAHLLGSDYTDGLPGIGPVTALEILTEFPDTLAAFRDWFTAIQQQQQQQQQQQGATTTTTTSPAFHRKFRRQITKLFLPPAFPDPRVNTAYLDPDVDSDPSAFQWGVPDLDALRAFLMATIGWSPARTDEVLVPVIRDMNRRETEGTQANITAFVGGGGAAAVGAGAFAPRVRAGKSKRMEAALERMAERARLRRRGEGGAVGLAEEDTAM